VNDDNDNGPLPTRFSLKQNYPNPFNPSTTISYDLPIAGRVRLTVCNVLGQTVATLEDERRAAGRYSVTWDGTDTHGCALASGVYFYRIETATETAVRKMIFLK